jgi:hypothetical protein
VLIGTFGSDTVQAPLVARDAGLTAHYTKAEVDSAHATTTLVQGRGRVDYHTPNSVIVYVPASLVMGGFRVFGSYRNGSGRALPTGVNGSKVVAWPTDLAVEGAVMDGNWYSIFAAADDEDPTVTFVLMPYFTVKAVAGRKVSFGLGGEGEDPDAAITYTGLGTNELAGVDVLLAEENQRFSRRTVSAAANTGSSITLDDVGGLTQGDRILAAPPGYDNYVWISDFYIEKGGEPRNIADMGDWVGSRMSARLADVPASGDVTTPVKIDCRSYISPLASGITLYRAVTLSTASTGNFAEYFWHDASSHAVAERFYNKVTASNETIAESPIVIPFSKTQSFYYSTAGTLAASAAFRSMQTRGWFVQ